MSAILEATRTTVRHCAPLRIDRLTAYRLDHTHHLDTLLPVGGAGGLVLLHAVRGGIVLVREGRTRTLAPGDLTVVDAASLERGRARVDGEGIALVIPRECLGGHDARFDHALDIVVTTTSGAPSLVAQILKGVSRQILHPEAGTLDAAAAHILGLVELALRHAAPLDAWHPSRHVLRAKAYIDENLSDIGLTPERIARFANVSIRTLHRSFEAEGTTIGQWIRTRRLEQCRRDLIDPALADMAVGAIGARWGIWDAAHFSRAFKQWLGASPSTYRAEYSNREASARTGIPV